MEKVVTATKVSAVRTEISAPLSRLAPGLERRRGRLLHFGAGHTNNPDRGWLERFGAVHYDPNYGPTGRGVLRGRDFQVVLSFFVLNILQAEERQAALQDITFSTADGGTAYVAVRSRREVEYAAARGKWKSYRDGYLVPVNGLPHFQRGYAEEELKYELEQWYRHCEVEDLGWYQLAACDGPYRTTPWRRLG